MQGSKKVPSGCLGQVDFLAGQRTFNSHLPSGQGMRQDTSIYQLLSRSLKQPSKTCSGEANLRATCTKVKYLCECCISKPNSLNYEPCYFIASGERKFHNSRRNIYGAWKNM